MTSVRIAFTSVAIGALLLPVAATAGGGSLSRADFERCNQQAMQVAGISDSQSPAASPSTSGAGTSGSVSGGTGSQSGSSSMPSASGSSTGGSDSTSSGSSVSGGAGTSGSGSTAASSSGDQDKLDKAVQAYRDCLQK